MQDERNRTRRAKRKLIDATNRQEPQNKRRKSRLPAHSDEEEEEVAQAAKKFTMMHLFWLHQDKSTFRCQPNEQYNPLERFENENTKVQGQLADLLEFLPSQYGDMILARDVTWLSKTVSRSRFDPSLIAHYKVLTQRV